MAVLDKYRVKYVIIEAYKIRIIYNMCGEKVLNPWKCNNWKTIYANTNCRYGLRLKFDKNVDNEVRRACKEYCKWLRGTYNFPMRIPVYIKGQEQIKANDGKKVSATFMGPDDKLIEPYIRVSAGDYQDLLNKRGKDDALCAILNSITHELTHYFQWINGFKQSVRSEEWQAKYYSEKIIDDYADTREHP